MDEYEKEYDYEKIEEMAKRYGQIYVDADNYGQGTMTRSTKDSYYWYQKCIRTNGEDLD